MPAIGLEKPLYQTEFFPCAVTGSLAPRPSGKNVFTFSVASGSAPCARPNEVINGIDWVGAR